MAGWAISSKHLVHEQYGGEYFTFLLFDRYLASCTGVDIELLICMLSLLCMFSAFSVLQTLLIFENISNVSNVITE